MQSLQNQGTHGAFHFFSPPDISAKDVGIAGFAASVDESEKEHRVIKDSSDKPKNRTDREQTSEDNYCLHSIIFTEFMITCLHHQLPPEHNEQDFSTKTLA